MTVDQEEVKDEEEAMEDEMLVVDHSVEEEGSTRKGRSVQASPV